MKGLLNTKTMHPREQISLVMSRIYDRALTTTSGGNISIMDDQGDIWITPSGVDKGLLLPSDIVCVKSDGTIIGKHKPSSEYPFHLAIYKSRPDIKAVLHAHPPGIVAFSIVQKIPDIKILPQIYQLCGKIGYAAYAMPGTDALGTKIAGEFMKDCSVVIMENHGAVVGGEDVSDAYQKFEAIEAAARSILSGNAIGKPHSLSERQLTAHLQKTKQGFPVQSDEVAYVDSELRKRAQVVKIVQRGCKQGLIFGAYGSVSARWRNDDFVITPGDISKWDLTSMDLVQVSNGRSEKGKVADAATALHQQVYKQHKYVNAIIIAQPVYLTSFAITNAVFNVRTIPETWIYLQDVPTIDFIEDADSIEKISNNITEHSPVLILKNESVLVTGNKILQAFDNLEVAEFSAKSIVLSTSLGNMVPIDDAKIDALGKVMERWKNYNWEM